MAGPALPLSFGKYTLTDRIAAGGMAEVYRAKIFGVAGFEKVVAVKRILPHFAEDDGFVDMFVREANIAVKLSHSNIVQVFELGRVGDHYYIALEFVEGRDLKALVRQAASRGTRIPWHLAAFLVQKVCAGLHHAHTAVDEDGRPLGIVHRDISPHNVLVSWGGEVKVADFGIAKLQSGIRNTRTGTLKGKLAYMSPEQAEGDPDLDARSDVFAAGIVLYECLTGVRPFDGESDREILRKVRLVEPPPPSSLVPGIAPALDEIVALSLRKGREQRYPDAAAMGKALAGVVQGWGARAGRVVDDEDVGALMRDLLGPKPAAPRASAPGVVVESAPAREGTPVLPPEIGEASAPSLVPTRSRRPDADGASMAAEPSQVFAAAPPTEVRPLAPPAPARIETTGPRVAATDPTAMRAPGQTTQRSEGEIPGTASVTRPSRSGGASRWAAMALGGVLLAGGAAWLGARLAIAPGVSPVASTDEPAAADRAGSDADAVRIAAATPLDPSPAASAGPAPEVPAVVAAAMGSLRIEGSPAAAVVSIGGREMGRIGETIAGIGPGTHAVTVTADHHRPQTLSVPVEAGRVATHTTHLVRGRGEVRVSKPLRSNYQVNIPGVTQGFTSTVVFPSAPAGVHRAEIRSGSKRYVATVVVRDRRTTVIELPETLSNGMTFRP